MREQHWPRGRLTVSHRWKHASILAQACRHEIPLTVHPGIGYDIISNHPVFNGAAIGRAGRARLQALRRLARSLEGGVVLSIGSAIMGPQVFEKALSCVNNLRLQAGRDVVRGHSFYVVDLQDGGNWDWTAASPPRTIPAYYLRFCKSYSRMGRRSALRPVRQFDVRPSSPSPADRAHERGTLCRRSPSAITSCASRVVGDFFLDRYLHIDPARTETSIETGLPVYNVVEVRSQPGAAGTILNNLVALGIGEIHAIGFCGDDGEGFELRQALAARSGRDPRALPHHARRAERPSTASRS